MIDQDLQQAIRSKDALTTSVLRGVKAACANFALTKGNIQTQLSDVEVLGIIRKQIKQRQDSIAAFSARPDLIAKEESELKILQKYLPAQLTDDQINEIVELALLKTGATSKKEMGAVMKEATKISNGRVDGKTLSAKIGARLV